MIFYFNFFLSHNLLILNSYLLNLIASNLFGAIFVGTESKKVYSKPEIKPFDSNVVRVKRITIRSGVTIFELH